MPFPYRHQIYNACCLVAAVWLTTQVVPGAALSLAGWSIAALVFLFTPGKTTHSSPVVHELTQYLTPQLAVGLALLAANFLFLNLSWGFFLFIPIWIALTLVPAIHQLPWRELALRDMTSGRASKAGALHRLGRRRVAARDDLAICGAIIAGIISWLAGSLSPVLQLPASARWLPALLWLAIDRVPVCRWQEGLTRSGRLRRLGARQVLWTGLLLGLGCAVLPGGLSRELVAWLVVGNLGLGLFGLSHARGLVAGAENLRRTLLLGYAFWLLHPFATNVTLGAGDSSWYVNTFADVLAQTHAGVFPVFVGQSEFMFNGGIFPLRLAPLLQHYGMITDLFTLGSLDASAVLNLVLILNFVAAGLVCYAMLGSLLPGRRWLAAGLAALYLGCPGLLALVYSSDLYMTWSTLPWLPVAFGGCLRAFRDSGPRPFVEMAAGLALAWWGHAPVALWSTVVIGLIQLLRLARQPLRSLDWRILTASAGGFLLLALYPFVSVLAVPLEQGVRNITYLSPAGPIVHFVRETFPGILLPLKPDARSLADFQLGWAILLVVVVTLTIAGRHRVRSLEFWGLAGAALALLLLLLPVPGVNAALWSIMPGFIRNPTGAWAMQRLYLILAACMVFSAAALLGLLRHVDSRLLRLLGWGLLAAVAWSSFEATVFITATKRSYPNCVVAQTCQLPENNLLTRYSYLVFAKRPAYFSHGYVDPLLEQRLLARDSRQLLIGNADAVIGTPELGHVLQSGTFSGRPHRTGPAWPLEPTLHVEPGRRYLLEMDFLQPEAKGVLVIGGHTLRRVYGLPSHGDDLSFGAGPGASRALPLFTSSTNAGNVELMFVDSETGTSRDFSTFARYRWLTYSPADLPIRVTGWIPYRALVRSPAPAWLETPRMFQQGYHAEVDGHDVLPLKSPQGLVMIPVPAGESQVVLAYHPPLLLASAYFVSLTGMALVFAGLALRWWRRLEQPGGEPAVSGSR